MKKLLVLAMFSPLTFASNGQITATATIDAVCEATINDYGSGEVIFSDTEANQIVSQVSTIDVENNTSARTRLTLTNATSNIPDFNGGIALYQQNGTRIKAASNGGEIIFDSDLNSSKNSMDNWYVGIFDNNKASSLPQGSYDATINFTITCF